VDEAKQFAAEYVLLQLGVPMDSPGDLTAYDIAAATAAFGPAFTAALAPSGAYPQY
jgi:hypothetical protein